MGIDAKAIVKLRELTGAGMNDCQAALAEAESDQEKAVEILRKKGTLKADKIADRATKEGVIALLKEADKVAVVALACETDFVARNQDFIETVAELGKKLLSGGEVENFKTWAEDKIKNELIVKIGENLQLVAADIVFGQVIGSYLHLNKKIAAVVILSGGRQELANDLAMQIAALAPKYIKPEEIPAEEIDKEKEIYRQQLKNEGKPENILNKIIEGKLQKYYSEVCLIKQAYIKDDKITIEKLLAQNGSPEILSFKRYQI
ncbi:MAG: translation elongation factor Ts [Candidatus Buchananbacteria bacterium RIFCSPHIGHO2_02_FULL_45_11b]|uniref:Elongation factor Ts n=4 Tax=Candidatus Buchananiibacteriota TaxID=1817903 RepID=A0A1G1YFI4_9BACT|nr:MAG: translation elongation factor Ts [Candidatus Buchananbacteria bacterium RIFCSPHIGHO2_01_FULL_46_12]OGY51011.1 MAG: translation elongation factor Ts [Candidatus Buchananbacteria bacterium RIFCSPHIGHO2_02_FULL_45_11b]OGY52924.1 MAG: translation elongation factor Ts [Candidatus Buchananbacteria bacterium RIFCSPLOWO2_01_FULL_45_31]OGY56862.1 MAG: translation elongation factor Ts [Candidatus Buchananbacteria bacterium RIFCSPLOWO2_02_FULL_46_11b]